LGQHPKEKADTVTVLEKIGHFMDEEIQVMFNRLKDRFSNAEISAIIENSLDLQRVLKRSCKDFDGGYTMVGATGYGGSFVARDPNGIRPAYYYANDEVVVAASERPAIRLAFGAEYDDIKEVKPGHALIINKEGEYDEYQFREPQEKLSCSFERIYFSRGSDPKIYQERKMLGKLLCPQILEAVGYDLENTVFSFIPNTAETAFLGMIDGLNEHVAAFIREEIAKGKLKKERIDHLLTLRPRIEKIVIKDAKLRTFITNDNNRNEMVSQVYDTTSDSIKRGVDTLVILDDSIVRGTTLERSILRILDKIGPKKIIIVSSAPQIRYPDCYGIDMSKVKEFVAFRALLDLLKDRNLEHLLDETYDKCKASLADDFFDEPKNYVKELFDRFTEDEISVKVSEIVKPKDLEADVEVIYQKVENLHKACPDHLGDWYFTGNYPTPGGNKIVNKAFVNFMEGKLVRAY
jgi:amidophosphoribosyltransferase